jgi:indole-3-glycerol phosphate synthase
VTATYLDRILDAHRRSAALEARDLHVLIAETTNLPTARGFGAALRAARPLAVISEVKRRSPSKGDLFADLDPGVVARHYRDGGAACISVLTDEEFFGGSVNDLTAVSEAVGLPVLRKDFTVSAFDVVDARLMGADAILLIVAALDDRELQEFHDLAVSIGLDVLVEVHDEAEAARAMIVGASIKPT